MEKWPSGLEDVLTRVPLLIRTPGGTPGVVAEPVQLFDLVPTLLELAEARRAHRAHRRSDPPQSHRLPSACRVPSSAVATQQDVAVGVATQGDAMSPRERFLTKDTNE